MVWGCYQGAYSKGCHELPKCIVSLLRRFLEAGTNSLLVAFDSACSVTTGRLLGERGVGGQQWRVAISLQVSKHIIK